MLDRPAYCCNPPLPLTTRALFFCLKVIGIMLHFYTNCGIRHLAANRLSCCIPLRGRPASVHMSSPAASSEHPAKRRRIEPVACVGVSTVTAQPKARPAAAKKPAAGAAAAGKDEVWLIVGLGNPGPRYEKTRHNVGFMVVDSLARSAGIDMRKLERSAAVGRGELHGRKVILAKPVTFMNNSGESVAALARFYKVPSQRVLVVSDDLDQPPAAVRLRQKGGHGGHNGLRSIIQHLGGSHDFPRIKIGIGRPNGELDIASYVLQEFKRSEMAAIDEAVAESIGIINSCLALGMAKALSGQRL